MVEGVSALCSGIGKMSNYGFNPTQLILNREDSFADGIEQLELDSSARDLGNLAAGLVPLDVALGVRDVEVEDAIFLQPCVSYAQRSHRRALARPQRLGTYRHDGDLMRLGKIEEGGVDSRLGKIYEGGVVSR